MIATTTDLRIILKMAENELRFGQLALVGKCVPLKVAHCCLYHQADLERIYWFKKNEIANDS